MVLRWRIPEAHQDGEIDGKSTQVEQLFGECIGLNMQSFRQLPHGFLFAGTWDTDAFDQQGR